MEMTSKQRVIKALNHEEPDRIPLDLGGSAVTGMNVSTVYKIRQALKLDAPGEPVKVVEPYQMLGEIKPDLVEALGVDVLPLGGRKTLFGFENTNWKPWTYSDGTPVLVPEGFNTEPEENGDILLYPEGDKTAKPSGRMPKGGFYFDAIVRQPPLDEAHLDIADNLEEFALIGDDDLAYYKAEAERLAKTGKAVLGSFGGTSFGDIALVPAMWLKDPKGIRDIEEWYVSTVARQDHIYKIFERQCEIALQNLEKIYQVVGDVVTVVFITGTDFGAQQGPFISKRTYRNLFKPFHKSVNDWVHQHTNWKTFIHSCGSVSSLIEDFIEAGFDILNPVQVSAANMDPQMLKEKYGDRITFWGGGVDTQKTLPFGMPEQVVSEVRERIKVFGKGGGFVFNTVHNVQPKTPVENILAVYDTLKTYGKYPLE